MDNYATLQKYLDLDAIKNLKILHKAKIITVNRAFISTNNVQLQNIGTVMTHILTNYEQTKSPDKYIVELLKGKKTHFLIIWRDQIIFFNVYLTKTIQMLMQCNDLYVLNIETYHLDLNIDDRIHNKNIFQIISYPTTQKIKDYLEHKKGYKKL